MFWPGGVTEFAYSLLGDHPPLTHPAVGSANNLDGAIQILAATIEEIGRLVADCSRYVVCSSYATESFATNGISC